MAGSDRLPGGATMNALSIDVEDYFQVSAFTPYIARTDWEARECRVERNVERILGLLDESGARATFFTLGWIAERYPQLVRRIVEGGHELASHGFGHQRASEQTEELFFSDIDLAKIVLEDVGGVEVRGYRAPSFSINNDNQWAFDCLSRAGYKYSSSVYPVRHDHYGMPEAPRFAHFVRPELLEIPISTIRVGERNWPAGGGGFFRLLPYALTRRMLRRINRVDRQSAVFYFHPWELDPEQPRIPGLDVRTRFRHYVNLAHTEARLTRLLADFIWGRIDEVFPIDGEPEFEPWTPSIHAIADGGAKPRHAGIEFASETRMAERGAMDRHSYGQSRIHLGDSPSRH
jgi:polysaccharide deacetylase family protein (PEP-CTERM system associated)